jgi:DNA-binding protein H-NS
MVAEMAAKAGFSVNELFGASNGKRSAMAAKSRNPKDPSQTWTGRGRKPIWIVKAGGDIERFRI